MINFLRGVGLQQTDNTLEGDLRTRVSCEFLEMPGLRLTVAQAARLFSLDRERCRRLLESLVQNGVLTTDGTVYQVAGAGRRHA